MFIGKTKKSNSEGTSESEVSSVQSVHDRGKITSEN